MYTLNQIANTRTPQGAGMEVINSRALEGMHYDPGLSRPYRHTDGQAYVDVTVGYENAVDGNGEPIYNSSNEPVFKPVKEPQLVAKRRARGEEVVEVTNATTLRKDQWIRLDATVGRAIRKNLKAYADLRASVSMGGFNAMGVTMLEREIVTDPGTAQADMDGLSQGKNFQPKFALQGIPLPITHSDFWMSKRFLATSQGRGMPQDDLRAEIGARRCAELVEKTTIGTVAGTNYGVSSDYLFDSKVYGYLTHPDTMSYTSLITSSALAAAIGSTGGGSLVQDVLEMLAVASVENVNGPFVMYVSPAYDDLLDYDYKPSTSSGKTIRQRLVEIGKISSIRRLDYLTGDKIILVQMDRDTVEAVNGMEFTVLQWATEGGQQLNFKVMGIQVPYIKSVYRDDNDGTRLTGIVVGSTS